MAAIKIKFTGKTKIIWPPQQVQMRALANDF